MPHPSRIVDLRSREPEGWKNLFLRAFEALQEGHAITVLTDRDPRFLFHILNARHPGCFVWLPSADGPPDWRLSVTRLVPLRFERRVGTYLRREQDEIELLASFLLADLRGADPRATPEALAMRSRELQERLELHFRKEEKVLFVELGHGDPAFAPQFGEKLLADHEALRDAVAAVEVGLSSRVAGGPDLGAVARVLERATALLREHAAREEEVYGGLADGLLSPGLAAQLLARFRGIG